MTTSPAPAFSPATTPTMYFVGVTTGQSSINRVFPQWAARLRLGNCELRGVDLPLLAAPANYQCLIKFIKEDPLSIGALVTSHKVALFQAAHDAFDEIDPLSRALGEISSIYKRGGRLRARSVDPWTVGCALDAFLPAGAWGRGAEACIFGAGGSGIALAWHLTNAEAERPARIHLADRNTDRLEHARRLHATWRPGVALEYHPVSQPDAADALVARLPAGSLVVNATGLGKDAPGSPVTDAALFPRRGFAWDFNYRGKLVFLEQARAQAGSRGVQAVDGWTYFVHGWTQVIGDVFDRSIPTRGPLFDELGAIAARGR